MRLPWEGKVGCVCSSYHFNTGLSSHRINCSFLHGWTPPACDSARDPPPPLSPCPTLTPSSSLASLPPSGACLPAHPERHCCGKLFMAICWVRYPSGGSKAPHHFPQFSTDLRVIIVFVTLVTWARLHVTLGRMEDANKCSGKKWMK